MQTLRLPGPLPGAAVQSVCILPQGAHCRFTNHTSPRTAYLATPQDLEVRQGSDQYYWCPEPETKAVGSCILFQQPCFSALAVALKSAWWSGVHYHLVVYFCFEHPARRLMLAGCSKDTLIRWMLLRGRRRPLSGRCKHSDCQGHCQELLCNQSKSYPQGH